MDIKDLQARQGNVDIVVEVVEVGEARSFEKFGRSGRVATATVKDDTGEVKLTLWNDQIDQVKAGDKVHITNGYVGEYQGEKQLTTGKFGKLEVVGKGEAPKEEKKEEAETPKPADEEKKEEQPVQEEPQDVTEEEIDIEEEDIE
jgi:replication factor A1